MVLGSVDYQESSERHEAAKAAGGAGAAQRGGRAQGFAKALRPLTVLAEKTKYTGLLSNPRRLGSLIRIGSL